MDNIPYGCCKCGCGQKTTIAHVNCKTKGWTRGEPIRYIRGHSISGGKARDQSLITAYRESWLKEQPNIPYGYCWCGCGEKTHVWELTASPRGRVKGEPARYVRGHNQRLSNVAYIEQDRGYETPCWIWQRSKDHSGYGQITVRAQNGTTTIKAHRAYFENEYGPIPEGLDMDHLCRVRSCINPTHLEPVTNAENQRRGANTKLTWEDVHAIRRHGKHSRQDVRKLAEVYGVTPTLIRMVLKGTAWRE